MWQDLIRKAAELIRKDEDSSQELLESVESARKYWLSTKAYFDNVTDPDLIDHAIYAMTAAEGATYTYCGLPETKASNCRLRSFNLLALTDCGGG